MSRFHKNLDQRILEWIEKIPLLQDVVSSEPVLWLNPLVKHVDDVPNLPVRERDMTEAAERWRRFAPFLKSVFPEVDESGGIVESPLQPIHKMKRVLERFYGQTLNGNLLLKCDNELPIAGSIKARGGVYEVLKHTEMLTIDHRIMTVHDDYKKLTSPQLKDFFSQYSISVGSTGNLGLSIGIMGAVLGFNVNVHMSADAKQWKKELLRAKGVNVYEYQEDFSRVLERARKLADRDPKCHFVDDEHSRDLFLGYSVAAYRLRRQLKQLGIEVSEKNPLFVYLPCGVGGAPGGITFGLKHVFGRHVHCFFAEPTQSPAVLLGLVTGKLDQGSVQDFGLDNRTEADGLAVGRASRFATKVSRYLINGLYTIPDDDLFKLLTMLADSEGIKVEPSAAAGLAGPFQIEKFMDLGDVKPVHIAWATGGMLVPNVEMERYYRRGKALLES